MIQRWAGRIGRRLASLAEAQSGVARGPIMDPYLTSQAISVLGGGLRGYIDGLILSNNGSDATNDLDIAPGFARDGGNTKNLVLAASLTKQLDAAWAVGTNAGGLDTGSIANTTYHIWLIMRSDTGNVDVLFSASATAPTMPASYDYKRLIGSLQRVGGAWQLFKQINNYFALVTAVADINIASSPGGSVTTRTMTSIPNGVVVIGDFAGFCSSSAGIETFSMGPTDSALANVCACTAGVTTGYGMGRAQVKTNTSKQISSQNGVGGATESLVITTVGWWHPRGTNA